MVQGSGLKVSDRQRTDDLDYGKVHATVSFNIFEGQKEHVHPGGRTASDAWRIRGDFRKGLW